jgi:hypothetical protein
VAEIGDLPPELIQALLQQKGLAAYGGNIRLTPFAKANVATGASSGDTTSPTASAAAGIPTGENVTDEAGNVVGVVGADGAVSDPGFAGTGDPNLDNILAALAGAGGAAAGMYLGNKFRKDKVPLVSGSVEYDPIASALAGRVVEGEYTEVRDPRPAIEQKAVGKPGPGEPTVAEAIAEQRRLKGPDRRIAEKAPRAVREVMQDTARDPIPQTGMTVEERAKVDAIADELVARRKAGNADPKAAPKRGLPTGPEDRNSLVNTIIELLRNKRALKALQAIP